MKISTLRCMASQLIAMKKWEKTILTVDGYVGTNSTAALLARTKISGPTALNPGAPAMGNASGIGLFEKDGLRRASFTAGQEASATQCCLRQKGIAPRDQRVIETLFFSRKIFFLRGCKGGGKRGLRAAFFFPSPKKLGGAKKALILRSPWLFLLGDS